MTHLMASQGGKREGSGRKRLDSDKKKMTFALSKDVVEYLDATTGKPKNQIVDDALRAHKARHKTSENPA